MLVPLKIKCPRCKRLIPKRILKLTDGRCNNCGYLLANSLKTFTSKASKASK